MTIAIANTGNTNTIQYWLNRTNELADALSNKVVTVNSNSATGNATIVGTFQANTVKTDAIQANGTVLTISSNVVFSNPISIGNTSVNSTINSTSLVINNISVAGVVTLNSFGVLVGANVLFTTSGFSIGNTTSNVQANSTSISINGREIPDIGQTNTNITSSTTVVDTLDKTTYRGAEYVFSVKNNSSNGYQMSKILVLQDGSTTDAHITEYAVIQSNGSLGVFTANSNSSVVRVYFTLTSGVTNVQIKAVRTPVAI